MMVLLSILAFLIAVTILVAIHEWGHFYVARCFNIRVLRFSLGFGKVLTRFFDRKGTEYVLSAIPLGGYVKFLDEREEAVPEEEKKFAFNRQAVWKRMLVILAGPTANFLLAIFIYWAVLMIGVEETIPLVATPEINTIAAKAGLKQGDEVVEVDHQSTPSWMSVRLAFLNQLGKENVMVTVKDTHSKLRSLEFDLRNWKLDEVEPDPLISLGVKSYLPPMPVIVGQVFSQQPAEKAGIQVGDRIIELDGQSVTDWQAMVNTIQKTVGKPLTLTIERNGHQQKITVIPETKKNNEGKMVGMIGVQSQPVAFPKHLLRTVQYSIFGAFQPAVEKTVSMSVFTLKMLGKMIVGQLSVRTISGPIGIAQGAGQSASLGLFYYLNFLALLSISLGVLNLLPIPMLDGGQFLYCFIEWLQKKPVSMKTQMMGFRLSAALLIALMAVAFYNDVIRLMN